MAIAPARAPAGPAPATPTPAPTPVAATPIVRPAPPAAAAMYPTPPPLGYRYVNLAGVIVPEPLPPVPTVAATSVATTSPARTTTTPTASEETTMVAFRNFAIGALFVVLTLLGLVLVYNHWGTGPIKNGGLGILGNGTQQQGTPDAFTPRSGQAPIATEFGTPKGFGARDYKHNCPASMKPVVTQNCAKKPDGTVDCKIECR